MESDYDRKFEEMKKYIPFLESMIRRLENTSTGSINPRQAQLSKIRALRDLLLDKNKRMKMENLLKCEQVLVNLYAKVESRDTLPGIQKAPQSVSSTRQIKSPPKDLETVRRKLKAVQVHEVSSVEDTLPEIARANQIEVDCSPGSKEPALFQRRPHKASPPMQITTQNQPSSSKRSYTRVLVSPPPSDRRWTTSEDHITPDNHLFHRRSPKKSPNKKDRKKFSKHDKKSTRSDNNLNITLNVPEESINSLNTEDIVDRIINCDNTDVDIGTLRDLRSQILSELKQTGTNEDISDLILKSYRNKSNKSRKKPDVEEGELSDSESEIIENVYGSLVIADGDKQSGKCKEATASSQDPDIYADSRKIQIHLVISNSNKEKTIENTLSCKVNDNSNPILNDPNKSSFHSEKDSTKHVNQAINISSDSFNSSTEMKLNNTNDDLIADEAPSITVNKSPETSCLLDVAEKSLETETVGEKSSKHTSNDNIVETASATKETSVAKIAEPTNDNKIDNKGENKANFYKPIVEPEAKKQDNMESKGSKDEKITLAPEEYLVKLLSSTDNKEDTHKNKTGDLKPEESVQIPFLSEPSTVVNPSKESKNGVSEIDILQALKNEILSETIAIPGTETVTPALHQPKITKVVNAHEIAVKKKISLENYKKKSAQKKPLYKKETPLFGSKKRDDVQVPSRGLTTKELERFNLAHLALGDSSDEEEEKRKENEDNISIDDVYGDLAPRSPDAEILSKIGIESPVIIPEEPVEAAVVETKGDVDMRTFISMVSPQNSSPMTSNEPAPYKPPKPDTNRSINEPSVTRPCDPRKRNDNFNPSLNHSNSLHLFNPGGTPRPMSNFGNMTPSRAPNMVLNMTPSRAPNMTPNARTFEMTPSHSFEIDDQSTKRKHVYAPVMWESCDKDTIKETCSPRWETNETSGSSVRESHSKQMSTRWGDRDPRSSCVTKDETSDHRDKYQQRRDPRLNNEHRDDGYLRSECPPTPSHYFGRGDYPSTPIHTFGRADGPMTPMHPFGRSDKPATTPSHPFGSGESPSTPSHQFGRSDMPMTPSHPFGRSDCPNTPSHPFGRTDCPTTPSHPFGRSDYPTTPSHPFSRSDCPGTPSHPFGRSEGYLHDPRYKRGGKYDNEDDRNYSRDRNPSNYYRCNSYGSDKLNRYSVTNDQRFGRERSVGRNDHDRYNREQSVGRNDQNRYIPTEGRCPNSRDTSVGRTREPSVGRVREPSIGRNRESCFGRISRDYDDLPSSKDYQQERRSGHESRFDHVPSRSYAEVGTRRERSIGRTMPTKQKNARSVRASSINRTNNEMLAGNTVSVESHAGRSFTIDTSINATFQEFNLDEASRMFDARRKRAASVGRSLNRESSVSRTMRPDFDIRHEKTYIQNKNTSKFSRACSVGRDLAGSWPERSFKEIKADFESFKTKVVVPNKVTRGKSVDKCFVREDSIPVKKNVAETKTVDSGTKKAPIHISSRDPRSRKDIYDAHKNKTASSSKKDAYSPRKNIRDPRMRRDKQTTSTKYKTDHRHRNQYDNQIYGIVYTNEAIAKGNILGPGYGVKNYKIPKIKRLPEESTEKEPDMSQSDNEKEKDSKEIIVDTSTDNNKKQEIDTKSKKQTKDKSDVKTKTGKSKKVDDLKDVSPIRTRRTRKAAIVYSDIDSESDEHTEEKLTSKKIQTKTSPTKTVQKLEKKSVPQAKETESNDNDSLDFNFDIQDEDIDLFSENIASDTVIDNINDLIADLDKDIGATKSNESMITKLAKDSIIENILESLTSANSTNFVSENIQDESLKKQVMATAANVENSSSDATKVKEQNNMNETENICKEIIQQTVSEILEEKIENPSPIVEKPNEAIKEKEIKLPLLQASTEEDNLQTVSTSISEESNSKNPEDIIERSPNENGEACSTPDSTINTEDNISQAKSFHENPTSTISAQTEMNSDISSTHEVTCKDVTAETSSLGEAIAPKSDSLGSILSLLKDKSKIKELLSMLDDKSDNEKLKKKLEKLSEIVSDDEDFPDKSKIVEKEITKDEVQLDSKYETSPIDTQQEKQDEKQSESVDINKLEKPVNIKEKEGEMEPSEQKEDQPNKEKGHKNSEEKESSDKEDKTSNNENAKVSSSDDEADNEPIVKRSQSRAGKKIIRKGKKARWPSWAKKLNKLKVQVNEEKRVTRSESTTPQAKPVKRGNRELQLLQEDIRDMFISDDVLNATGIRMCRLAKLVEEKNKSQSNESSPTKTNESGSRSDADLRDYTEPGPVVVLEKFSTKKLEPSPPKPMRKKPGPKPKPKPAPEKPLDTKTSEKPKPIQAYRPGPKSKTKVPATQNTDPYEFKENDTVSESTTKTSENTPFNSDSESESLNSSKSYGSMELLAEKKPRGKKRRGKWQMGVIKSKRTKKNANKPSPRLPVDKDPEPEPIVAIPTKKCPDMDCFIDKSYCFVKSSSTYDCRLCEFKGESIVHHYKKHHPHYEIPLSRMHPRTAFEAIKQSMTTNFEEISKVPVAKYVCRFCMMIFDDKRKAILEEFFWHVVSSHTGEYKQLCSECLNIKKCTFMLDIPPPPKDLKGLLMGYICGKCNYTQVSLENLKNHVSLRHNDEETEVYAISLGVMTQKMVETLKMLAIEESPRTTRSLRSNNSSINDEKSASEAEIQIKRRPRGPRSVQSKIQFESESVSDEHEDKIPVVKSERDAGEKKNTELLISTFEDPIDDHNINTDLEPEEAAPEAAASDIGNTARTTLESIRNNSPIDVFVESHFKINYTDTGNKEYLCCINGHHHYTTSLLISMKKHVQTKHTFDVWDGYCSVCKVIVMSQGIHKFKDCLAHFLDKHPDNFPVLEKTPEVEVTTPSEHVRTDSSKPYIQVRPISELISNQSHSDITKPQQEDPSIAFPKIESVVSLNIDAISNPSVVEQPQENPIADANNYDEPAAAPQEIIEINYEEVQKEVMSKKHRIVLDMMMTPDKLAHVFKCAGRYCSFTCASTEDALVHASTHQRVGGEDALICSYCSFDAGGNAIDLVSHVFKEHGACQFCCKACFYRAITSTLVEAHYIRMHGVISPGVVLQATIISSFLKRADESEGLLSRQEAVKHYVCCSDAEKCRFKTFTPGKFMEHLSQKHADVQSHDCNECPYIATSTMDLLQHLQSHGLKLYQCTWCVFGADTENEMLGHASIKHPMKRPQAYLRHIIESKDGSSTAKFKVLPFVHITKKTAMAPVEVPLGAKLDNPVREAERALELEKLIGHTDQMIENFNSEIISSPIQSRVTVLDEEEELIDSESFPPALRLEDQPKQQKEAILEPVRQVTPAPVDIETPKSERATPQLKIEATEKTPTKEDDAAPDLKRRISDVIYCLDSDEEDLNQGPGVINLSDDNNSNTGPPPPIEKTTATDKGPKQRFPWLQLFKCSKCNTTFKSGLALKRHYQCCFPNTFDEVWCPYCPFKTEDKSKMIIHYTEQHGQLDRYTCGICKHEETSSKLIRKHFGTVHALSKLGFKMQNKTSQSVEYLVDALNDTPKSRGKRKRSNNDPPISAPPAKVRRYGPGDVSLLPINQIFDELAQCSLCEFSTKVRQNLIRHLQLHSQQQSVPQIAPVNPVPHLETNEMHFDRMLNLASSSIANKTTEKASRPESEPVVAVHIPPEAAARYPKYITERQRYACGAKDCSYISIDEAMLKCHWETLHSGSNDYHCVHCPTNQQLDTSRPLTAARIIAHLKMHDVKLFACTACSYYHHQQHILDKHLAEKHNGNAQVKVVRGPSTAPSPLVPTPPTANAPTMDLKPWQCGLCKFKSMLRPEVVDHCSKHHQSKFQYKCAFCPWRSSTLENVTKHHSNSHSEQQADVFYFYYREGSISDEPDGTPRWMKQRLKAGLPVAHEVKTETEPPVCEAPTVSTPMTIQQPTGVSVDLNIVKSEIPDPEGPKQDEGTIKDLCMKFGNFCDPNGIRYKCSLCKQTMEDTREGMQSHLYEELKYRKWGCSVCSYRAFHKKGLKEHAFHEHRKNLEPVEMSSDKQIETWVSELLDYQENIIKNNLTNFQNQKIVTPEKKQPSTSQPQEKENETTSTINKLRAEESLNISKQELAKQLGPFGEPKHLMFCCPKCDDQIKEESKMNEHLEMELSKVRWCCSNCPAKFQHYHLAQLHCRTVHFGQSAKAVEAVRDPKIRSAWIAAVIQVQKLSMNIMPITSVTSAPSKSTPSTEKDLDQEPAENSLLVVRYEENVPNPETSQPQEIHTRRKRPSYMGGADSDDDEYERLVIDEEPEKKTDTVSGVKCPYCECRTSNRATLNDHMLRHYNLKPYRCAYCDFNAYNQTMYKHIEKIHPGKPRSMTKVKVPDTPPTEINITLGRGGPTKRRSKDNDAVFCLYCEATFPESNTHTHPNREPQFARPGENVLKCNHCVTLRKDLASMQEHYKFNHPSTSLDISQCVIKEDRESRILCTTKRCRKPFKSLDELKSHHVIYHAGQLLHYRDLTVVGQYQAVPIEGQIKLNTFECVDLIDDTETPGTSVTKRKLDNPIAVEPKRFAKKSTTKLPFTNAVAKKSTTKLPFYEELSDSDEEEYSYYGTKPPCLDGYANISTLMASSDNATPLPVTLPALRSIVDIAPKVVVKDIKKN